MVTREDMEQLRSLIQEHETLEQIYGRTPKTVEVADTYGDYRTGFKKTKVVRGRVPTKASKELRRQIEKNEKQILEKVTEMEKWMAEIDDSFMRDVIRLYYAAGMSQEEIGLLKGYEQSAISKKLKEFWQKWMKLE